MNEIRRNEAELRPTLARRRHRRKMLWSGLVVTIAATLGATYATGVGGVPRKLLAATSDQITAGSSAAADVRAGRDVFRFETFGNEGFWTDAMRLPQGMKQEKITLLDLLETGFHIDADALDAATRTTLAAEFKTDLSLARAPLLHDPMFTDKLIKANALIGIAPKGAKVGVTCAICHTITDASVYQMPGKGSVGRRLDGRATYSLAVGAALAVAANSRAYYPNLQLELRGKTIGRAPTGLRRDATEAEVDAYLRNPQFYPRGTFDETPDGIGNPVQNTPLFRQDLAAPFTSNGLYERLEGISNASYTTNLDLSTMATAEGRELLNFLAGAAGQELHDNYVAILKETGVTGYPFVNATLGHKVGHRDTPIGRQADRKKILAMKAYLESLPAPPGEPTDAAAVRRGASVFETRCTSCHNMDQGKPVRMAVVPLGKLWPAYAPVTLAQRKPPLSPVRNSPGGFDDKMVIADGSERGLPRGVPAPLLLDLARKPAFLHDNSVPTLSALLDPARGATSPHPFYVKDVAQRGDVIAFLRSQSINRR